VVCLVEGEERREGRDGGGGGGGRAVAPKRSKNKLLSGKYSGTLEVTTN